MSTFDPFGDIETRGYLRNHAEVKNPDIVKRLEHNAFSRNILRALNDLKVAPEINLEQVQKTHRTLFADVYPWAGQDRSQNASDLHITKGAVDFQLAPYVPHGVEHALKGAIDLATFRENPGKLIGELAYAHPFLDGNGRTITVVVSELSRRAGFHIAWEETNKQEYLKALTKELDEPRAGHLTSYLKTFIRDGVLDIDRSAISLTSLPGLSAPDRAKLPDDIPTLNIVAGPNGVGKSTLTASGRFGDLPIIDPDAIARTISPDDPESAATRARKRAHDLRRDYLSKGRSFVVETTLADNSTISLIEDAKQQGFKVNLKYIGLDGPELAQTRVAARVAFGGHDVSEDDVRRGFIRSLENLSDVISKSDQTELYENSGKIPNRHIASLKSNEFRFKDALDWATDAAFNSAQNDLTNAQTVQELERATERAFEAARASGISDEQLQVEVRKMEHTQKRQKSREGHDLS